MFRMKRNYENADLNHNLNYALEAINSGTPVRKAARNYKISESTLRYKIKNNQNSFLKPGPEPILRPDCKRKLTEYLLDLGDLGKNTFYLVFSKLTTFLSFQVDQRPKKTSLRRPLHWLKISQTPRRESSKTE